MKRFIEAEVGEDATYGLAGRWIDVAADHSRYASYDGHPLRARLATAP